MNNLATKEKKEEADRVTDCSPYRKTRTTNSRQMHVRSSVDSFQSCSCEVLVPSLLAQVLKLRSEIIVAVSMESINRHPRIKEGALCLVARPASRQPAASQPPSLE